MKNLRAESLDSLRGFAIFMMVLSGSILTWILPAWMAHAQCPPPSGTFDPSVYGITWVDLVFPFFLFSMGAAYPFAIGSRIKRGAGIGRLIIDSIWRFIKLAYFALFLYHINPWALAAGQPAGVSDWLITLCGFVLLFAIYLRIPWKLNPWVRRAIHWVGVIIASAIMVWVDTRNGGEIDLFRSNIIILVLANMAAFGTIIYILTMRRPWARVAVLPLLMGIILCKNLDGTWQQDVFNWSPLPWLYRFDFLKYLFIIIPGTFAGEYLRSWIVQRAKDADPRPLKANWATAVVCFLSALIIGLNVWMLFDRILLANFFVSLALVIAIRVLVTFMPSASEFLGKLVTLGGYLLMLGLVFEAFDGGVRKDPSTFNYYFITSGLACYCLAFFVILCDIYRARLITCLLYTSDAADDLTRVD
ncbi:MAG: DUF5009 domain-containing protein, partial [Muribaculaceae bacterium]|nr:DUF5009 domain-containing protein [Muribaculaceae bacterium]